MTSRRDHIILPRECLDLVVQHRTEYRGLEHREVELAYHYDLTATLESFRMWLPRKCGRLRILDIGCGLAGIDVLIRRELGIRAELVLADRNARTPGPQGGFHAHPEQFAAYCDFRLTRALLEANGVTQNVRMIDLEQEPLPADRFDLVVSLLSWGFHYPINTYRPDAASIICDCRRGTGGVKVLEQRGRSILVVAAGEKYRRVVAREVELDRNTLGKAPRRRWR